MRLPYYYLNAQNVIPAMRGLFINTKQKTSAECCVGKVRWNSRAELLLRCPLDWQALEPDLLEE